MSQDQELFIGAARLVLPSEHRLPRIMADHPHYDYLYWNLIRAILEDNAIKDGALIDIGANVGDTISHFRRFSEGPVWGIEPDPGYFSYLERNTAQFENIRLSHAIAAPDAAQNRVRLAVHHGTGSSSLEDEEAELYRGDRISPQEIAEALTPETVLKSDTDGFDGRIIRTVTEMMAQSRTRPAIIAFEGPTRQQTERGQIDEHRGALRRLQQLGYRVHMLTNTGHPVATVGCSTSALDLMMDTHRNALQAGTMMCPYLDFICVAPGLGANALFYPPRVAKAIWADIHPPAETAEDTAKS
ncbi:FkbM family methyltransferase [Antarctobacter jejuensis]|uniref:FkbM family methyltransferase n=1 Tax=Antarctobacter jejuensis TaxID=1439938 RepID=UPI003FD5D1CB